MTVMRKPDRIPARFVKRGMYVVLREPYPPDPKWPMVMKFWVTEVDHSEPKYVRILYGFNEFQHPHSRKTHGVRVPRNTVVEAYSRR